MSATWSRPTRLVLSSLALTTAASSSAAQFDNRWVEFELDPSRLSAGMISDIDHEVDFAFGDLDRNGFDDLVVVRKQPFTTAGKRTNVLLMNVDGVLTDRTAVLASASDVPGDQGFLTPTNDRDAVLVDVDLDGWLDVVTATTFSSGDPKALGHPRIYMNIGEDAEGDWQGLEYQEARFPQLLQYASGLPTNPRFCAVAAGDVTGDGYPELYFGDYDSGVTMIAPPQEDMNDRLLINDGTGHFVDESQARMSSLMLSRAATRARPTPAAPRELRQSEARRPGRVPAPAAVRGVGRTRSAA